jgi:hypothetical protein
LTIGKAKLTPDSKAVRETPSGIHPDRNHEFFLSFKAGRKKATGLSGFDLY